MLISLPPRTNSDKLDKHHGRDPIVTNIIKLLRYATEVVGRSA